MHCIQIFIRTQFTGIKKYDVFYCQLSILIRGQRKLRNRENFQLKKNFGFIHENHISGL